MTHGSRQRRCTGRVWPGSVLWESTFRIPRSVQQLRDQLNFVVDCRNLDRAKYKVESIFFKFLDRHLDELLPRYGVRALGLQPSPWSLVVRDDPPALDPRLFRVSPLKMNDRLACSLGSARSTDGHGHGPT